MYFLPLRRTASRPFWIFFFQKKFFLLHPHENQSRLLGYQGWIKILMITLVYSKRVSVRNNLLHSVNIKYIVVIKYLTYLVNLACVYRREPKFLIALCTMYVHGLMVMAYSPVLTFLGMY